MTEEDFLLWHNSFQTYNNNLRSWGPYWFDNVENSHEELRNYIGGENFELYVKTECGLNGYNFDKLDLLIKELFNKFERLNRDISSDSLSYKDFRKSSLLIGTHFIRKTSKYLTNMFNHSYSGPCIEEFNRILSLMGQEWEKCKYDSGEFYIELLTDPISFCRLGTYEVDNGSCFKGQAIDKYLLGQTKDTFILLIKDKSKKIVGRFWGFATENYNRFNLCNFYFSNSINEGTILEALKIFFAKILKSDPKSILIKEDNNIISPGVFHNNSGNYSFFTQTNEKFAKLLCNYEQNNIILHILHCKRCAMSKGSSEKWNIIDDLFTCEACLSKANYCHESKLLTLIDGFFVILNGGQKVFVSKYYLDKYPICSKCYLRHESDCQNKG